MAQACSNAAKKLCAPLEEDATEQLVRGFKPSLEAYTLVVAAQAWGTHSSWLKTFGDRYDPAVKKRIERIQTVTPAEQERVLIHLSAIRLLWSAFFLNYDFLVLPATPCAAMTKAECTLENRTRLVTLNAPASLGGLCVLTLPVALPSGLTTGLQVIVNNSTSPVVAWALERWKS